MIDQPRWIDGMLKIAWSMEDLSDYSAGTEVTGSPSARLNPDELVLAMLEKAIHIVRWDVGECVHTRQLTSILAALEKDLRERRNCLPTQGNWWPRTVPLTECRQEPLREEELSDPEFKAWLECGRRFRLGEEIRGGK